MYASSLAIGLSGGVVEHDWEEVAPVSSQAGRPLMVGARVRDLRLWLGSVGGSYKKVESGGIPDMTPPMIKSVELVICDLPSP
ncbi:hypothetical protein BHM03_00018878 [Ensete ventricosum]|uniref:Uncharacterized protein n=1 Tax=Ensete ventricosum TaxID=4639 RepID=A0A445MFK8_ENSVE|nr:hypothetical protein BHM03_00018878 [Ensete ventricosum]